MESLFADSKVTKKIKRLINRALIKQVGIYPCKKHMKVGGWDYTCLECKKVNKEIKGIYETVKRQKNSSR